MPNTYDTPAGHSNELLRLISRTISGRALLEPFLPLLAKRKATIEDYPTELRMELRKYIPRGHPIGACLIEDQIFIDFEAPRGVSAAFLVHEIAYFLALRKRSTLCHEDLEAEAIKKQLQFTCELRDRDPDYEAFLKKNAPKVSRLQELLEFEVADFPTGRAA